MAVTIKDVAERAKVSPSTVSRVISQSSRISDPTKQRVYQAMEELNYRPNAIARNLASASTRTIGLIIPNSDEALFENPFFIQAMRGISLYAQKKSYKIMFNSSANPAEELAYVKDFVTSRWVDGIVLLTAYENDPCIDYLRKDHFPFVVIGRPDFPREILWVDNDNFQATYQVTGSLIAKGATDIAFIGGPQTLNFSKDRLEGFLQAMHLRQLDAPLESIIHCGDFNETEGYRAMEALCQHQVPQAVVTTDDLLAVGVLTYCQEHSLSVKVTGFNNIPLAMYHRPSLTSVDIKAQELGYEAAKLLIQTLEGEKLPVNHRIVDTVLIERDSTK